MPTPSAFYAALDRNGFDLFVGVPDSLLKHFCAYLDATLEPRSHIIAANEGGAIAIAAGHYLATQRPALVYMQNSGLGNAVNPLLSLADPEVYGLPMLLLIGWRGEPGVKDEPQHTKQGRVTTTLLEAMEVPFQVLSGGSDADEVVKRAREDMDRTGGPVALLAREGTFTEEPGGAGHAVTATSGRDLITREAAVRTIADALGPGAVIVSTTGKTSRELYEHRASTGGGHAHDFLTVGSMGHSSQIALGIALAAPTKDVYCLDGDGALIMHAGALAITGQLRPANYHHIVLNNGVHDSVGGQPTAGSTVDFAALALASGYRSARTVTDLSDLRAALDETKGAPGPTLLEVRVCPGARSDLGRPKSPPQRNRDELMRTLRAG